MADLDASEEEGKSKKKKGGLIATVGVVVALTLLAGGGGWFLGGMLSGKFLTQEKKKELAKQAQVEAILAAEGDKKKKKPGEDSLPHLATKENGVVMLEPITSNLAYPSENWIRLEIALMFTGKPDEQLAEEIHQDILAYLRTVSLQQVERARGFEYLKDDIKERAEIRSKGRVKDVLFRTFIIE
jgi:flagellar protein FliL